MSKLINKNREKYTVVPDNITRNTNLSPKGRGMLITLLSLPENWEFSENGLTKLFKGVGRDYVRTCLKELEQLGYLKRFRSRNEKGYLTSIDYQIFDSPQGDSPMLDFPTLDKPTQEKPALEQPTLEKLPQLNTQKGFVGSLKNNNACAREGGAKTTLAERRAVFGLPPNHEPDIQTKEELIEYLAPILEFIELHKVIENTKKTLWKEFKSILLSAKSEAKLRAAGKLELDDIDNIFQNFCQSYDEIRHAEAYVWAAIYKTESDGDYIAPTSPGVTRREKRDLMRGKTRQEAREDVIAMLNILKNSDKKEDKE